MDPLRIVFMGTADLACPVLEALAKVPEYQMLAVVTQPDRPKGRDLQLSPPPVKVTAQKYGWTVYQPIRLRAEESIRTIAGWEPDLIVVAAYGQILPPAILSLPQYGCLNVHASLLPRYRGASPIQWAILNGDPESGVTIMKIDEGLDTGPMLKWETTPIRPDDNAQTLHDRLADLGGRLLLQTIPEYVAGRLPLISQSAEGATYARKITKEDGRINWSLPAGEIACRIRAFNPWPGSFSFVPGPSGLVMIKFWEAEVVEAAEAPAGQVIRSDPEGLVVGCGLGALRFLELQREGKRRMKIKEFLAGFRLEPAVMFQPGFNVA
ncbi:MAG TPA: methionyl-tRNA formyltransferase [Candidatus Paceibacterota bacterium]|nr:methionyl-tRNA formyltransferase [Verrucomicrobiota bacterium]HRY48599.1 methionyl-tRNA formyltransferase [Candidatus Paceibacterota bacterium]HSA01267.1 methionyl-tRNA formyltransferase [Candidatus Paceibacterota bacterium]